MQKLAIFGLISISFIIGFIVTCIDTKFGNGFLHNFFNNQLLGILATFIGFNVAGITFLSGNLNMIEMNLGKECFSKTRKEIKHNIFFMISIFIIIFFLLLFLEEIKNFNGLLSGVYKTTIMGLFMLEVYAVVEVINVIVRHHKDPISSTK